ncbi:MAG: GntR family transcriptional regulator [Gammaproteobacteria bacterium]|nr:GntR family transcriptional regulator [Gammaproteobacteria bacterium]MDH3563223.1 GntR family transcriptional regulator [Gammaproteobacteria bacterium]
MRAPTTIVNFVHDKLRDEIISGRYAPGMRLNESKIAREMDISRIPVREALVRLREQGLVMKHDRRGMFVTELTTKQMQQINSVRIVLEAEALRLCRARIKSNKKRADKLKSLLQKMEEWDGDSGVDAAEIDIEFHRTIWATAGNPYLVDTLDSLCTPLFVHSALQHVSAETTKWRLNHHHALLDVVLGTSEKTAEEVVIAHLKAYYIEPEKYSSIGETTAQSD